jgi:hypothetical protein
MLPHKLARKICAPAAFILALTALGADKFPDYPARSADAYTVNSRQAGVIVAVEPVEDLKDQKKYLGTELSTKGYLPVFLVVENGSGESLLFDKAKLTFGDGEATGTSLQNRSQAGEAAGLMSAAAVSPAGLFIALKLIANASQVQQNMLKKEVQSKTLSPGTSVHGFLYIPIPKKGERATVRLHVPLGRVGTDDTTAVELTF